MLAMMSIDVTVVMVTSDVSAMIEGCQCLSRNLNENKTCGVFFILFLVERLPKR